MSVYDSLVAACRALNAADLTVHDILDGRNKGPLIEGKIASDKLRTAWLEFRVALAAVEKFEMQQRKGRTV